jgi:chorismate synthase
MLRVLTSGESHGPLLSAIIDGLPAGLPLTAEQINAELLRRQQGYGSGGRMHIERDEVRITAGLMNGRTTGAPIALHVENRDFKNWQNKDIAPMTTPRPGHADLTGAVKYGYRDLRLALERASARETTMRVAAGAVCKAFLAQFGIVIGGYVVQIGDVRADLPAAMPYAERLERAEASDVRCPEPAAAEAMHDAIHQVKVDKDTLGGVFEVVALHVPTGWGRMCNGIVSWTRASRRP